MKKKWLLLPVLLFALTGCAKAPGAVTTAPTPAETAQHLATTHSAATTAEPATAQQIHIGLLVRGSDGDSRYDALCQALEQPGVQLTVCYAENDQSAQDQQAAQLEDPDLLIADPVIPDGVDNLIATAQGAGIPLLLLDHKPEQALLDSYEKLAYVGYDPSVPGTMQAALAAQLPEGGDLNGDGTITCLLIAGPEDETNAQLWAQSATDALSNAQLLEVLRGDWSQASGNRMCALALSKYGRDIELILCGNELMTLGVVEAIEAGGWTPGQDVYVTACGSGAQLLSLIRRNAVFGTVQQDTNAWCAQVSQIANQLLAGQAVDTVTYLDYTVLTGNNAQNDAG